MEQCAPKKIPYIPSQDYRYELSEDEFSRKRFRILMEIFKELQAKIPQIPISFCMFGSLTKGKVLTAETAKYADVDLEIKYDREALDSLVSAKEKKGVIEKLKFFTEIFIQEKMLEAKDSTKLEYIHADLNGIDSDSIWIAVKNIRNSLGVADNLVLANYFTLSIGEAVKKYRDKFLKELATMQNTKNEKEAKEIWNKIRKCVELVERRGQIPEKAKRQFPQTIEEALKFYEVK